MIELLSEPIDGEMHHCLLKDGDIWLIRWGDDGLKEIVALIEDDNAREEIRRLYQSVKKEEISEAFRLSLEIYTERECIGNIQITTDTHHLVYSNMFIFHESETIASSLSRRLPIQH